MDKKSIEMSDLRTYLPLQGLLLLFVGWSLLLAGLLYWNVQNLKDTAIQFAEHDARMSWEQDSLYRYWGAVRGGVYAPLNEDTPVNPHLKVPDRDVIINGKEYTLVNPAYMTRQVYELAKDRRAVKGHITSLNPLRPQNAADPWETKALRTFELGNKEYSELVEMDGKTFLRLMQPFTTQKPCLKCHADQGYKLGDIRGGISISIPMDNYFAGYKSSAGRLFIAYVFIWLTGSAIIFRANSVLKKTMGKLRRSERHAQSMLKNLDEAGFGFSTVSSDHRILHMNKTMRNWFGNHTSSTCYASLHNRKSPCRVCYLEEVVNKGRTVRYELTIGEQTFDVVSMPLVRYDGTVVKMEIRIDITSRKHYEDEQRQARKEAEAATAAKTVFLANMSHDIRTPLNGIIGMLRLTLEQELGPEQRSYLKSAKTSADFLYGLLNNILDISKIDADQLVLDEQPFGLAGLLVDVESLFTFSAAEKKLQVQVVTNEDVPVVLHGDSLRLRQVLMNLVGNAIKFTDQGTIRIVARLKSSHDDKAVIHFSVADNGIGIASEKQREIFESFSQADSSTTRKYGGTGLGLAICKRLVEMMDGKIWVESEEGKGSTFHFTAEFRIGSIDELTNYGDGNAIDFKPGHLLSILLVEDNELNRDVARMTLENAGHRVHTAIDGVQAMEAMVEVENEFDVILMDVQMPRMDGLTAARYIRSCEQGVAPVSEEFGKLLAKLTDKIKKSRTPIVALTANAMNEDRAKCIRAGMDDYLSKPFQPDQVMTTLHRVSGMMSSWEKSESRQSTEGNVQEPGLGGKIDLDTIIFVREHLEKTYNFTPDQITSMFDVTRESLSGNLEKATTALKKGDDTTLASTAHSIKGTLLNLGLSEWAEKAKKIEIAAKEGKRRSCTELLKSLRDNIEENLFVAELDN